MEWSPPVGIAHASPAAGSRQCGMAPDRSPAAALAAPARRSRGKPTRPPPAFLRRAEEGTERVWWRKGEGKTSRPGGRSRSRGREPERPTVGPRSDGETPPGGRPRLGHHLRVGQRRLRRRGSGAGLGARGAGVAAPTRTWSRTSWPWTPWRPSASGPRTSRSSRSAARRSRAGEMGPEKRSRGSCSSTARPPVPRSRMQRARPPPVPTTPGNAGPG
jgi:hypothetical protein